MNQKNNNEIELLYKNINSHLEKAVKALNKEMNEGISVTNTTYLTTKAREITDLLELKDRLNDKINKDQQ